MGSTSANVPGYSIEAERGRGGMGRVFKARSTTHDLVALKILDPDLDDGTFTRRFAHEVELGRQVRSRHVAAILDADASADPPWVAMEYVDGPTLQERVSGRGPLATPEVLGIVRDAAQALVDIHAAGIVHRDLKPSNIICGTDGVIRVTDFGIAAAAGSTQLTVTGQRIGTLAYTSPEQLKGAKATGASDVFALGAVAYYAASGASLFGGGTDGEVIGRILAPKRTVDERLDPRLAKIVEACLREAPGRRPLPEGIVEYCVTALTAGHSTETDPDRTVTRPRQSPTTPSTHRRAFLIAAGTAAILLIGGGIAAVGWALTRPPAPVPTIAAAAVPYPRGDQVRLEWNVPSTDTPRASTLLVNGRPPPTPCPSTVTGTGTCTFKGQHGTTYAATVSWNDGDESHTSEPTSVTTYPAPRLTVRAGDRGSDASGATGCPVLVDGEGLEPNHTYTVTWMTKAWQDQGREPQTVTLGQATDDRGSVHGADLREVTAGNATQLGYGSASGWVRVQLNDLIGTKNPWGCE